MGAVYLSASARILNPKPFKFTLTCKFYSITPKLKDSRNRLGFRVWGLRKGPQTLTQNWRIQPPINAELTKP